jgi:hypothetical protein
VHPALATPLEPILVVALPGVAETSKSVMGMVPYESDMKLIILLYAENVNLTHEDLYSRLH